MISKAYEMDGLNLTRALLALNNAVRKGASDELSNPRDALGVSLFAMKKEDITYEL